MKFATRFAATAIFALCLFAGLSPALANLTDFQSKALVGGWDFASADGKLKCRITLRKEAAAQGMQLNAPAPCRRSMKIMNTIAGWSLAGSALQFLGSDGKPLLIFDRRDQERGFLSNQHEGVGYALSATGEKARDRIAVLSQPAALPSVDDKKAPPEFMGRYQILRASAADTGCVLVLERLAGPKTGTARASLAPGCQDSGLQIFDPTGWNVEFGDRLFMISRKGHSMGFTKERNGDWTKDPAKGSPMMLKRIAAGA